ncbi:hypothetical protein KVV02_003148 [Mortierella alpina]|uniref:Uncharacterized protein n=1 Tax=Mortierella alpina TaxID=64518 RepID=A0A9P8A184_MORAP|nr:hypothetical protein KVV02_003148 [Mortierella alpina]
MATDFAAQVKNTLDSLYSRVFDYHPYQSQSHTQPTPSAAAVSSAVSEAAAYLNSYLRSLSSSQLDILKREGSTVCEPPANNMNYDGASSFCDGDNARNSAHPLFSKLFQSLANPGAMWTQWDPSATVDNILWNYTPDIQALQQRLGLDHLSETYNIDPRILLLTLALPLILLILTACALKGAGHTSDNDAPHPHSPARKADPHQVGHRKGNPTGETTKQVRGAGGSSKASSKKGDHSKKSSSRGGAQDKESDATSSHALGNNYGLSSWGAMMGSAGFYGGEAMNYKPINIYAAMKDTALSRDHDQPDSNSVGSLVGAKGFYGGETLEHPSYKDIAVKGLGNLIHGHAESSKRAAVETSRSQADHTVTTSTTKKSKRARRAEKAAAAEGAQYSKLEPERQRGAMEPAVSHSQATPPSASNEQPRAPSYAAVASLPATETREADTTTLRGLQEGSETSPDLFKTQPRATVQSKPLRTRTQPPSNTQLKSSEQLGTPAVHHAHQHQDHTMAGRDLGSKILGFVHGSELLRNMDAFSGGVLGSAVATVAALASTAESTASLIKDNLPDSVTDFTEELKESFDHAMRTGGLEGQGILGQSDEDDSWGIRQAISQIIQDDDDRAAAQASGATPRKKSFAEVAAAAGAKASTSSSNNLDDDLSMGVIDQTLRKASISYADKVKSHTTTGTGLETEVHPETRRRSVHNERENEDYFLVDDSGDDADDDNDGEDEDVDDDENVDDGSRHSHHTRTTTTPHAVAAALSSKDAHGHYRRVHPHDEPHTGMNAKDAAGQADRTMQEYTIDQHGNKVPVVDVRRDSGFDLLV